MDLSLIVGFAAAIAVLWAVMLLIFAALRPKNVAVRELVRIVPDVVRLIHSLITDSAVPVDVRVILVGLLLWIVSPIDLIPEFIPVLGPLDDVVVAVVAMRYVRRRMGMADLESRWSGSAEGFTLLSRVIGR